jgi:hypothetical protein
VKPNSTVAITEKPFQGIFIISVSTACPNPHCTAGLYKYEKPHLVLFAGVTETFQSASVSG